MRAGAWPLVLFGCTASAPPPPETASAPSPQSALAVRYDDAGRLRDEAPQAAPNAPPPATIGAAPAPVAAARPPRAGPLDVHLYDARLDDVLRALAAAGRFSLVLSESLSQSVSVELTRVEPYEALLALAEAHHLAVSYARGVVTVTAAGERP